MTDNKNQNSINKLADEILLIIKRVQNKMDWSKIDKHQSLTFLDKNYRQKPSDIAKFLIIIIGIAVFLIEGLRTVTILMCYVLPVGVMIMKLCQSIKNKNLKNIQQKKKRNESQLSDKSFLQKNESMLSINSKQNENQFQQQKSEPTPQINIDKQGGIQSNLQNITNKELSQLTKKQFDSNEQIFTENQLCKIFIFYFIVNLIIDLIEPFLLLGLQTTINFMQVLVSSCWHLIIEGDYWPLIWFPFEFVSNFILHIVTLNEAGSLAKLILIFLRILFSALLLNMNKQQSDYCQKILYEKKFFQISALSINQHLKDQ